MNRRSRWLLLICALTYVCSGRLCIYEGQEVYRWKVREKG